MPRTLQKVFGSGGWVVDSEFSVLLWSKALVLDLDQAEQNGITHSYLCTTVKAFKLRAPCLKTKFALQLLSKNSNSL